MLKILPINYVKQMGGDENHALLVTANVGITVSDTTIPETGKVVFYNHKGKGDTVRPMPLWDYSPYVYIKKTCS